MSDTMLFGVLRMSFEMAMKDRSTQFQYWQKGQEATDQIERLLRGREFLSQALNDANDWGLELQTENERLREALQFYASFADALPHENITPLMVDRGNRAKAALKKGE
jgi:hypothetical protein